MTNWNKRLEQALDASGLSKAALARQVGVSGPTVTDWISGQIKTLQAENAWKICAALRVSPEWLLFGSKRKTTSNAIQEPAAEYVADSLHQRLGRLLASLPPAQQEKFVQSVEQMVRAAQLVPRLNPPQLPKQATHQSSRNSE